ncbi:MAG: formate dehydrogenase accessory sulfurtransferase FdhD, partial [Deltaproteobacteria bacterium]|nr:formate dehydrogenase accessory sulfurtransferase FdhD [Deltaproteobacteria bacterium]
PLKLIVNRREVATLICSPHDLRFLAAGFLRLQGFVQTVSDFHMLSVCNDFGIANVGIRGDLPDTLKPVLTSGCGAGISFTVNHRTKNRSTQCATSQRTYLPAEIFGMMEQLARLAENYKSHGGIHSAAVGDGTSILLYAEDLGRHNTLDRIAGEALLKGIDLSGTLLVTSGRVSTELAAKAAMLGISVIASRTSPTDMAVKMCEEAGILLIGYVRGTRFTIYTCPERVVCEERIELTVSCLGIKGEADVVLTDGASTSL